MLELLWGEEPKGKMIRKITKAVTENRANLLTEWEATVNQ